MQKHFTTVDFALVQCRRTTRYLASITCQLIYVAGTKEDEFVSTGLGKTCRNVNSVVANKNVQMLNFVNILSS